ncbi:MAG TPA: L,D-transpeptidase family protein [Conexibacter sp.]|jgi:lipoprotein-anchoring transpeptidase ErfK/SrfK|nr:L,D-transpeptidase family protein [Conexibacter sp.]
MPRRVALPLLTLVVLLAVPGAALADAAPAVTVAAAKPAPKARAKPAPRPTGRMGVQVAGAFSVNGRQLAVAGRPLQIEGRVVPYVAGQSVSVRIWRGHKLLKQVSVRPKPTRTKKTAVFSVRFVPERSGDVQIFALHERTAEQRRLLAKTPLSIVTPKAGPGTSSPFVALLQQRLAAIGYATPQNGSYDAATGRAVLAFRKVNKMPRTTTLTPFIVDRVLRGVGGFKVRFPQHGRHVEANLGWQVLALIDKGRVVRAYTTSSGKPSTPTVLGNFRFYMREAGTNSHGMVDSTYFIRGYAIHGYYDVPTYNASHGCLRVPVPDAFAIYSWIHLGDQIDVYY